MPAQAGIQLCRSSGGSARKRLSCPRTRASSSWAVSAMRGSRSQRWVPAGV